MKKIQAIGIGLLLVVLSAGTSPNLARAQSQVILQGGALDGGGGGRCEADYQLVFHRLMLDLERYQIELPHPVTPSLITRKMENIEIDVLRAPIQRNGEPEWKLAWSTRSAQKIELFCLEEENSRGWFSLSDEVKKVLVLHEALWWVHAIDDTHFNVSPSVVASLQESLQHQLPPSTSVGSSLYTEVFGEGSIQQANRIYFENIQKIGTAVRSAIQNKTVSVGQLPSMQFRSALIQPEEVDYHFWHFYKTPSGSLECMVDLKFSKDLATGEISEVSSSEDCYDPNEHDD